MIFHFSLMSWFGGPFQQLGIETLNAYISVHMWNAFLEHVLWNTCVKLILLFAPMHSCTPCPFMHTHACTHIHTHACTHMHTHACTCMHAHMHTDACTHMHTHACTHITHIHAHTCTLMHMHIYACTHAHWNMHMHAHTCTCTSMHAHTCMHTLITWLRIHGQGAHTFKHKEGIIHTLTTEHTKVHGLCNGSGFSYVISVSWKALQACTTGCWRNPRLKPKTLGQSLQQPMQTKNGKNRHQDGPIILSFSRDIHQTQPKVNTQKSTTHRQPDLTKTLVASQQVDSNRQKWAKVEYTEHPQH